MTAFFITIIVLQLLRAGVLLTRSAGYQPKPSTAVQLFWGFLWSIGLAGWGLWLLAERVGA